MKSPVNLGSDFRSMVLIEKPAMLTFMRVCLLWVLLLSTSLSAKPLDIQVSAEAAILINAKTGAILFEKEAHQPMFPASTTKIATALTVLKCCADLDAPAKAGGDALASITPEAKKQSSYRSPPHWLETDGSHMGIKRDEEIPIRDLLVGILVGSANDAANVVAQHVGGTVAAFMQQVNQTVAQAGALKTFFLNPHGLHHPDHMTTSYDLAMMTKEAMTYPLFREIVSKSKAVIPKTNLEHERTLYQTNQMLRSGGHRYPKAIGVKTGTTSAAGKTLVAAAQDGERELIGVVLGVRGKGRYDDMKALFEAAFQEKKMRRTLLHPGPQKFATKVRGGRGRLKTELAEGLYYDFFPSEDLPVRAVLHWELPPLPIEAGVRVGHIALQTEQGVVLKKTPLLAAKTVRPTLLTRAKESFAAHRKQLLYLGSAVTLILFWMYRRRRKQRRRHRPLF